jgi:hypothetical protein
MWHHPTPDPHLRPSAEILVDQLLEEFEGPALEAALAAVKRKLAEVWLYVCVCVCVCVVSV